LRLCAIAEEEFPAMAQSRKVNSRILLAGQNQETAKV
jgi:hypothetical protein